MTSSAWPKPARVSSSSSRRGWPGQGAREFHQAQLLAREFAGVRSAILREADLGDRRGGSSHACSSDRART